MSKTSLLTSIELGEGRRRNVIRSWLSLALLPVGIIPELDVEGCEALDPRSGRQPFHYRELSPASRAYNYYSHQSWGSARKASLHPRLYAVARFAGWISFLKEFEQELVQ